MADLAVMVLTYDEEVHIGRALRSVASIARELVVIDSGSTDRTVEIAKGLGARVLSHPFVNQARQFQWGLDNAGLSSGWVMRLDADEVIEPDLAAEIERRLPELPAAVAGVILNRKHIFMGRWIRHGGRYPMLLLRIWRNGAARVEDRWMDEHVVLDRGATVRFKGGFADVSLHDLSHFIDKHNRYATREAIEVVMRKYEPPPFRHASPLTGQARLKRNIKERIYNALPFPFAALCYLFYRYFLRLGFLDGVEGLIYHVLQGGWYRFLVGAKTTEMERLVTPCANRGERLNVLSKIAGFDLAAGPGHEGS
ncbi:MAG TPA: glycosyltransferase family 2 protein [Caulobacteraceae bacterium]|nr:glycosyltransferase family 2 protein [Caulobacteraceae bacterium]